jgi:hypothetical protein
MKRWLRTAGLLGTGIGIGAYGLAADRQQVLLQGVALIIAAGALHMYGPDTPCPERPSPLLIVMLVAVFGLLLTALYL